MHITWFVESAKIEIGIGKKMDHRLAQPEANLWNITPSTLYLIRKSTVKTFKWVLSLKQRK